MHSIGDLVRAEAMPFCKDIVIFGAGKRGRYWLERLTAKGYTVRAFCDNDTSKQGTTIDNIPVIAFEELLRIKADVAVLVSPWKADEMRRQLTDNGITDWISPERLRYTTRALEFMDGFSEKFFERVSVPGDYLSPFPDMEYVEQHKDELYDLHKEVRDIDFNLARQFEMLGEFEKFYPTVPKWSTSPDRATFPPSAYRYYYNNGSLCAADAIHLHCMLRYLRPRRLIEVGSGWTSALMMDTNELFFNGQMEHSFIEPYPTLLRKVLRPTDRIDLHESLLQDMPTSYFDKLQAGDVLFIDSSHVSKLGSDVNYLFFELLPRLNSGVYIHLHDIFYPFEYPLVWTRAGWTWSELHLLRAFLQNNRDYEIQYFQDMMTNLYRERVASKWIFDQEPPYGGSFWMKKL